MNRYTQIHSQIWFDEKIQALDDDCKLLFIYLLTSPHSNMIGYYRLPKEYTAVDLKWDIKRTTIAFEKLSAAQLIKYDNQSNVILILNFLKYNPIQGENQAKGAVKQAQDIPKSPLLMDFLKCIEKYVPDYYNLFEPLLDGIRTPFEAPSNPLAGSGTGTGTGTGKGTENNIPAPDGADDCIPPAEKPSEDAEDGGAQQKERAKTASAGKGDTYSEEFEQFWSIYPRKVDKKRAFRMWKRQIKARVSPDELIAAASNYAIYCQGKEPQFIKHASTFLGPDEPFKEFINGPPEKQETSKNSKNEPKSWNALRELYKEYDEMERRGLT